VGISYGQGDRAGGNCRGAVERAQLADSIVTPTGDLSVLGPGASEAAETQGGVRGRPIARQLDLDQIRPRRESRRHLDAAIETSAAGEHARSFLTHGELLAGGYSGEPGFQTRDVAPAFDAPVHQ
jgi:hypothetical protein